jgi:hypothetical protein
MTRVGILSITVIFLILAALTAGMAGCVSPSQNLEIRNWYDLDDIRNNLGGHHILMNDLDSTTTGYEELASPTANGGKGWQPIEAWGHPFKGIFDGRGYEIRDLFVNRPDEGSVGLFSYVSVAGVIQNVGVVNATVSGSNRVGGLVGDNAGTVSNSYSSSDVNGSFGIGGLVGCNAGVVSNSYSTGTVTGEWVVGGLVGCAWGSVSNSYSTGSVIGIKFKVGGLVGFNFGNVSNSYATGSVSGSDEYVGGLVGDNYHGTVSNCYATGSVTGEDGVGGLVGRKGGTVNNSFWDTETSGQATSNGGTGKTNREMQEAATFSGANWDITNVVDSGMRNHSYIWNIVDGQTYPFLSWQSVS